MHILTDTDGSDSATRAVDLAARLSLQLNARLMIIHVVTERDAADDQMCDYAHSEHYETAAEAANAFSEEKLRIARQRAEALGVSEIESASVQELQAGAIAETIMDTAQRDASDMIVLGKRGRGQVSALLLGSVSKKLVSAATCVVVVVP